ncbi:unnamed protein product [Rotaria sp. Silwood2]|nr:unnamed protein product [Rotaria sp. Silwood2]
MAGFYVIGSNSSINTVGYLYNGNFIPNSPFWNVIVSNDDGNVNRQFQFNVYLEPYFRYTLVVTTFSGNIMGPYTVIASGPVRAYVVRTTMTVTTETATTPRYVNYTQTTPNIYMVNTAAWSTWTQYSPIYARPFGSNSSYYYHYDTFDVTAPVAGFYTIISNSTIDTYGYLYNGSFFSTYPFWYLAAYDDDGAGNRQFRINVYLEPYMRYVLVATTFSEKTTGHYTVIVSGPARVYILRTTTESMPNNSTSMSKAQHYIVSIRMSMHVHLRIWV